MQVYALDCEGKKVFAASACSQKNYRCLECGNFVRVRSGNLRRPHYFHLELSSNCRLASKSVKHIAVQEFIQKSLGEENTALEYRFDQIHRIADVAYFSQKIVFEVQCSSITAQEARDRMRDYASLGWNVVWILHDHFFNKKRESAFEKELEYHCHYYTNITEAGGVIYDPFFTKDRIQGVIEKDEIIYKTCDLTRIICTENLPLYEERKKLLFEKYELSNRMRSRLTSCKYCCGHDFLYTLYHQEALDDFLQTFKTLSMQCDSVSIVSRRNNNSVNTSYAQLKYFVSERIRRCVRFLQFIWLHLLQKVH